jgi:hypothetical protein
MPEVRHALGLEQNGSCLIAFRIVGENTVFAPKIPDYSSLTAVSLPTDIVEPLNRACGGGGHWRNDFTWTEIGVRPLWRSRYGGVQEYGIRMNASD